MSNYTNEIKSLTDDINNIVTTLKSKNKSGIWYSNKIHNDLIATKKAEPELLSIDSSLRKTLYLSWFGIHDPNRNNCMLIKKKN